MRFTAQLQPKFKWLMIESDASEMHQIPVPQGHESSPAVRLTSLCLIYLTENNRASTENQCFVILMYNW